MQGAAPAVRVGGVVQGGGSRIGGAGKGRCASVNPRVPHMCDGCGAVASAVAQECAVALMTATAADDAVMVAVTAAVVVFVVVVVADVVIVVVVFFLLGCLVVVASESGFADGGCPLQGTGTWDAAGGQNRGVLLEGPGSGG
jgi:hypothetical protein